MTEENESTSWARLASRSCTFWLVLLFALLGAAFFFVTPDRSVQVHKAIDHNLFTFLEFVLFPGFLGFCLGLPVDVLRLVLARLKDVKEKSQATYDKMKDFVDG